MKKFSVKSGILNITYLEHFNNLCTKFVRSENWYVFRLEAVNSLQKPKTIPYPVDGIHFISLSTLKPF